MGERISAKLCYFVLVTAAVIALVPSAGALADLVPTEGKFKDVYYVNRAGVGRFKFFIIHQKLLKQMEAYEGRYIELEVLKGRQPQNPGPAIVDEIGEVKVLSPASLQVDFKTVTPGATGEGTFDIIYSVRNTASQDVIFNANNLRVGTRGYASPDPGDEVDSFFGSGYTRRQLSFGGTLLQRWNFISPMVPGQRTHFYTGKVLLRSGQSAPFVLHSVKLNPGQYEMAAMLDYVRDGQQVPVVPSAPLDIPAAKTDRTVSDGLAIRAQTAYRDEWLRVDAEKIKSLSKASCGERLRLPRPPGGLAMTQKRRFDPVNGYKKVESSLLCG